MATYDNDNYTDDDVNLSDEERNLRNRDPAAVQRAASQQGYTAPPAVTGEWNRQQFQDASWHRGGQTVSDWVNANQSTFGQGVKMVPGSTDKVILPSGEVMDLAINSNNGQGASGWTSAGHWNGTNVVEYGSPGAPGGGGSGFPSGPTTIGGNTLIQPQGGQWQNLLDQLRQRSQQGLAINRNDPVIRAQADAYGANEERAKRNYLGDLAEQAGPNANLRGETRMASERVGQRTGGYEADLMGRELTARRTEIAQALQQMQGMLTTEQTMQLQRELASMDDAIARMRLQQDSSQFDTNMGYNYDRFDWDRSPLNPANIPQAA